METVKILSDLINLDTQNPPGNEKCMTDYISRFCDEIGVNYEVILTDENRGNIIITIGPKTNDDLVVLGHLDVVMANKEDWSFSPTSADINDGYMYGRGTLDMKYFIAAALSSLSKLSVKKQQLKKGIVFVFSADEECGSKFGISKLMENNELKERLKNKVVLNEGGGFSLFVEDKCYYLYETGQKSVCRFSVEILKKENSSDYFPDLYHEKVLLEVISKITSLRLDKSIPVTVQRLLEKLSGVKDRDYNEMIKILEEKTNKQVALLVESMSKSFITPSIINGGSRNPKLQPDIKSVVHFDCRLLPSISKEEFLDALDRNLKTLPVRYKVDRFYEGYESNVDHEIVKILEDSIKTQDADIDELVPFITPGSNDGRFLKPLGCNVFGFAPLVKEEQFTDIIRLIHGVDERISIKSIEFCTKAIDYVFNSYVLEDK